LVELNSAPQIPPRTRYDVRPKYLAKDSVAGQEENENEESGHLALRNARHQLRTGEITSTEYADLKSALMDNADFAPAKSYAGLTDAVSGVSAQRTEIGDGSGMNSTGSLTHRQEEQYLQSLDAYLNGEAPIPRSHATTNLGIKSQEKSVEREREAQLRNPVSVYNWLRRNKPSVFLQDHEAGSDKPSRPAGARSSKRHATRDSIVKVEEEMYDEDGVAVDTSAGKGKRKRDDDGGYRPKGGNSRQASKRLKKEETSSSRRSKKASIDIR
jgi:IEC3 subunit of the Ino80 complex, chromatin re-modelling